MKVATTVLVLVVCLAGCADAYWWGGYGMGMYGMWGKRATTEYSPSMFNDREMMYTKKSEYPRDTRGKWLPLL